MALFWTYLCELSPALDLGGEVLDETALGGDADPLAVVGAPFWLRLITPLPLRLCSPASLPLWPRLLALLLPLLTVTTICGYDCFPPKVQPSNSTFRLHEPTRLHES